MSDDMDRRRPRRPAPPVRMALRSNATPMPARTPTVHEAAPFWKTKTLSQMNREEWESLCDGCGRCCLNKLEDEDTGEFIYTRTACKLLDLKTCQCTDYPNRAARVPDCVTLTPKNVGELGWLPKTCAYRLLDEGKSLAWWHPLVSGRAETVAEAGIAVNDEAYSEEGITVEQLVDHMWKLPKAKRKSL